MAPARGVIGDSVSFLRNFPMGLWKDMSENQYRELFKPLGIEAREIRHVLRYAGQPKRVYFNRNRHTGIYFSAHTDDEAWYPVGLWNRIDTCQVKKADYGRLNVVPRLGMETRAFRALISHW